MLETYRDIMTPQDMCEALGIRRSKGYALLSDGTIPSFRLGRKICVPKTNLLAFIEKQTRLDTLRRTGTEEVS